MGLLFCPAFGLAKGPLSALAVFAGGKIVKYRFSDDLIAKLLKLDFNRIDESFIKKHPELFLQDLDVDKAERLLMLLE